ncbi:HAD-like protein [Lactifluus volemus]|nr:HAD-like protein [Lactifluus volemus]
MSSRKFKAVFFDIGGVVVQSPLLAIREYENEHNIPNNYINCLITGWGSQGAWQKFERGEIPLFAFYEQFSQELSDVDKGNKWYVRYCEKKKIACPELPQRLHIDGRELFGRMMRTGQKLDKYVYEAILRIRAANYWRVIALTNNYSKVDATFLDLGLETRHLERYPGVTLESELKFLGWERGIVPPHVRQLFDDFVDSSEVGMRKPEHRFYIFACERNHVQPHEVIFLDDLGLNLKTAQELGMETIHVPIGGAVTALRTLGDKLGINLTEGSETEAGMLSKL